MIYVLRGLPASGKSTWAKEWVAEDPENRVRVNRDDIRHQLFGKWVGVDEQFVTKVEESMVREAVKAGKDVVVDAMHLKAAYVKKWQKFGTVVVKEFEIPVDIAVEKDVVRGVIGGRSVGEDLIRGMAKRYHIPADGKLPPVVLNDTKPFEFKPAPPNGGLRPPAIIVDIDGTMAKMNGKRGPYDTHLYHVDDVEPNLRDIVDRLSRTGLYVLVTSGRSEDFRDATEQWLEQHDVEYDELIMRKSGDTRNDSIVKHDLYHKYIAPNYHVLMAYDDRDRVVQMWREIGITTAQMDYGNF